jgi:hypothetical protein
MAAGFKNWTAGDTLTAADLEDYTVAQSVMRFADTSARNTALSGVLTEGMCAYIVADNVLTVYSGSAWSTIGPVHGGLVTWTPAVTQGVSVTATIGWAVHQRVGRLVTAQAYIICTSSGTLSSRIVVSLPVTASSSYANNTALGAGYITKTGAATNYNCTVALESTTSVNFVQPTGLAGQVVPTTLVNTDVITFSVQYAAAADA